MLVAFAAALLLGGILAGAAVATLIPPQPYVLDAHGVPQTLEQAGILKATKTGGKTGREWAIVLGKALFWDHQTGSDGNACAGCHFHAGADTRLRNQLTPGFNDVTQGPNGDSTFGSVRSETGAVLPGNMPSGAKADSNYVLKSADMPLHLLEKETDRNSKIITTTNDRVSSQGAFDGEFTRVKILGQQDKCTKADPSIFHAGPYAARQVEPRNTPTFHNAGFFFRNFWDGRANNLFNGVGVFGMRDVLGDPGNPDDPRHNNRLVVIENGALNLTYLKIEDFSLASQAVGPPTSILEMSCDGRIFADVGRKLLFTVPLLQQTVSKQDSVLGPFVSARGKGLQLQYLYSTLIMRAFDPKYWAAPGRYRIVKGQLVKDPKGYTQMELNFSMFWGTAIGLFELTQVADRSEFDDLQAAGRLSMRPGFGGPPFFGNTGCSSPTEDVDELLVRGCFIFSKFQPTPPDATSDPTALRGGNCFVCHNQGGGNPIVATGQPLLAEGTKQSGQFFLMFLTVADANPPPPGINNDLRDQGFASIGLRPAFSDRMSGNTDPYGNPLSFGRQLWNYLKGDPNAILDPALKRRVDTGSELVGGFPPGSFQAISILGFPAAGAGNVSKLEVDSSAKVPILRNVALTPPYFSWGGYPSLRQVLKLYNRGGNRRDITSAGSPDAHGSDCSSGDDSGSGPDGNHPWPVHATDCNTNTTGTILPLGLSDCEAEVGTFPRSACVAKGQTVDTDDLAALVRFLKSLTDPRVQCDMAPFDHPSMTVFNGHKVADANHDGKADDITFTLPAVGAGGYAHNSGYCVPNAGDLFAPGMQSRSGGPKAPFLP